MLLPNHRVDGYSAVLESIFSQPPLVYQLLIGNAQSTQTLPQRDCYTYRHNGANAYSEITPLTAAKSEDLDALLVRLRIR